MVLKLARIELKNLKRSSEWHNLCGINYAGMKRLNSGMN